MDCTHGLAALQTITKPVRTQKEKTYDKTLCKYGFGLSDQNTGKILIVYQLGLNITALGFLMRGLTQVWETELSKGMNASISGIAGIGHILTGICLILLLLKIRKRAA